MINKINGFSIESKQKNLSKRNLSQPSFGMAYHLDGPQWAKTFDSVKEEDIISSLINKIKGAKPKYKGFDGINYQFDINGGKLLYTKDTTQMMGNVKFIPNNTFETGFYFINNGNSKSAEKFNELGTLLGTEIKSQRIKSSVRPVDFMKNEKSNSAKKSELIAEYRRKQEILAKHARQLVDRGINCGSKPQQTNAWGANINTRRPAQPIQVAWAPSSNSARGQSRQNAWYA